MATYQIYELSARAVMSYAVEQDGVYTFALNRSATEHCRVPGAKHEQDSCAMFHQLMYQLHGKGWRERGEEKVTALSDVLFYMDFAGIFDRRGTGHCLRRLGGSHQIHNSQTAISITALPMANQVCGIDFQAGSVAFGIIGDRLFS